MTAGISLVYICVCGYKVCCSIGFHLHLCGNDGVLRVCEGEDKNAAECKKKEKHHLLY